MADDAGIDARPAARRSRATPTPQVSRSYSTEFPLITTDGYKHYKGVIQRTLGVNCVYGQVMKTWRKDRITKVERTLVIGSDWRLRDALLNSEDSTKLNTSFIERLNLTVRQGSAYLGRRTACHSRSEELLDDHLELRRCHYNFIRLHRALKFGSEMRTPAMQAGLARRRLSFRDIFLSEMRKAPSRMGVRPPESLESAGFGWSRAA